ncbi:MAG TPA: hypothetical protein VF526_10705 [Solirubrobacteraceae bacterium]|jgi:hypothetical protein
METADTITDLYRENTQGSEPSDEQVEQLLATLEPGEEVLFTCGWPDMSEKWGPLAQLTVTTRRILDQRWAGPGANAPVQEVALRDVVAVTDRQRGGMRNLFETRALVLTLANGTTLTWEHLTNHQVQPAAAAIERALEEL